MLPLVKVEVLVAVQVSGRADEQVARYEFEQRESQRQIAFHILHYSITRSLFSGDSFMQGHPQKGKDPEAPYFCPKPKLLIRGCARRNYLNRLPLSCKYVGRVG